MIYILQSKSISNFRTFILKSRHVEYELMSKIANKKKVQMR